MLQITRKDGFTGHLAGKYLGRRMTHDNMLTYDSPLGMDTHGNALGKKLPVGCKTADGKTVDSTGAFMVGELERLDLTLHEPLVSVTWGRDIDLREDVSIADEVSSFTTSTYASAGGLGTGNVLGYGKSWAGKNTTQVTGVGVDIAKTAQQLHPWANELAYTIFELESAAKLGRPIDEQKYEAMKLKHQMDIDEQVYIGDLAFGDAGLLSADTTVGTSTNVNAGASASTLWSTKSPDEILADFNTALTTVWQTSGYAIIPGRVLLPPAQYGYIATQKVSLAGNVSILKYVLENNLMTTGQGAKLEIFPVKWLQGAGGATKYYLQSGYTDRMVVYTKAKDRVRYPMTMLGRTPVQYDGLYHKSTYYCRLGVMEFVYPETIGYFDGI